MTPTCDISLHGSCDSTHDRLRRPVTANLAARADRLILLTPAIQLMLASSTVPRMRMS
jgi:hypothetical protein